jgi:hypothetical protein
LKFGIRRSRLFAKLQRGDIVIAAKLDRLFSLSP